MTIMVSRKFFKLIKIYWFLLIIIGITGVLLLIRINKDYLDDWDECIYAQYAKEMKQTRHKLTYKWNNNLILEKPPLYGWLMQIPYFFGVNEFTARFLSVVFGISLLIFVYIFSKKYFSISVAILSILLLLGAKNLLQSMFKVNTDIGFIFFLFIGFYCWVLSLKSSKLSYLSGLFFGLAVLNKGLSALAFLVAILLASLFRVDRNILTNYLKLIGMFLLTIIPWHLYQVIVHGKEFLQVYFYEHLFIRTIYNIFPQKSIFFYLITINEDFFPWYFFLGIVIIYLLQCNVKYLIKQFDIQKRIFFLVFFMVIFPLVILSIARTKVTMYIMPIYPYFAILIAYSIENIFLRIRKARLTYLVILLILFNTMKVIFSELIFAKTNNRNNSPSYDAFIKIKNYQSKYIEYLVDPFYRNLKNSPRVERYIPAQFVYGEKPCVAFYSGKSINFYYDTGKFKERVSDNQKGLFLVNNEDIWLLDDLKIKTLYKNDGYLIFEN